MAFAVRPEDHRKMAITDAAAAPENARELASAGHSGGAGVFRATSFRGDFHGLSGSSLSVREPGPALRSAALQNESATARSHASPKAMGPFSLYSTWLICAFHGGTEKFLKNNKMGAARKAGKGTGETVYCQHRKPCG